MFKKLRNKVVANLRHAKCKFFWNLHPHNQKEFWKVVKSLNSKQSIIPTLRNGDIIATSNLEKANLLNAFLVKNFLPGLTLSDPLPIAGLPTFSAQKKRYIACFLHLTPQKPMDMMTFQPECSKRLHWVSLQLWQNCSTSPSDLVNYRMNGKSHVSHLFPNQTTIQTLEATIQYHCYRFWVNFLRNIFATSYLPTLKSTIQCRHSSGGLHVESLPLELYWMLQV